MISTRKAVLALLAAALFTAQAVAMQHLIKPGDDWSRLSGKLRAGDEVILMPGRHRAASLADAHGESGKPIVIRGLDPTRPAIIQGDRYGLRLVDPRNVEMRDFAVQGGTIAGVHACAAEMTPQRAGPLVVERIVVLEVGPKGLRHSLALERLENVQVRDSRFEAWGGYAIDVAAGRNVQIDGCKLIGRDGFGQMGGIRLRAGTERATVTGCRFESAGDDAVMLGGASKPEEFLPAPSESAAPGSLSEVSSVQIEHNVFVGCAAAVAFSSVDRGTVRQNTIVDPVRTVVSLRREQDDPRFVSLRSCSFGANLIAWQPGQLARFQEVGEGADLAQLYLEQNLWWCASLDEVERKRLEPFPGTGSASQITALDPKLDAQLRPQAREARFYGASQ